MSFHQSFSYKGKATLWRIIPDNSGKYFWVEERDASSRSLSFTCLEPGVRKVRIASMNPGISWEGTLAAVGDTALAFHLSRVEQSPVFQGVALYSPQLDICLYEHPSAAFVGLERLEAFVRLQGELVTIPLPTGMLEVEEAMQAESHLPELYTEGTPHFDSVATFLLENHGIQAALAVHYLEWKGLIVAATYLPIESGRWSLLGFVLDANGLIVEKFTLAKVLNGLGNDAFFALGQYLVLLIDQDTVVFYEV